MTDTLLPAGRDSALTDLVAELAATVAAMPALPADDGSRYSVRRLTVTWLLEAESRHTRAAHRRDLTTFLAWCERERLHPLTARTTDISQFRVWRELQTHRGKTAAASTVARGLASVSSWYTHLGANSTDPMRNPVATTKRPKVNNRTSTTAGITLDEVDRLLDQADTEARRRAADWRRDPSPARHIRCVAALRDQALLRLLADLGLRIDEALARNLTDLTFNAGRRTLTFTGKGGLKRERAVPETTMSPLTKYLSARAELTGTTVGALTGALFATTGTTGEGRLAQPNVFTWLRKLAATAGIPAASRLSPHSLRHAAATGAKQLGVQLEYVQDALGHADPRTTPPLRPRPRQPRTRLCPRFSGSSRPPPWSLTIPDIRGRAFYQAFDSWS